MKSALYRELKTLATALDSNLVFYLLMIRWSSFKCHGDMEMTPWEMVVNKEGGDYIGAMTSALRQLMPDEQKIFFAPLKEEEETHFLRGVQLLSQVEAQEELVATLEEWHGLFSRTGYPKEETAVIHAVPKNIAQLMASMVQRSGGDIYDPCVENGALLAAAAEMLRMDSSIRFYGQASTEFAYKISAILLGAQNVPIELRCNGISAVAQDCFFDQKFDVVCCNPPFNHSSSKEEILLSNQQWLYAPPLRANENFAWLQYTISHLKEEGRAAILMPNGSLTSTVRRDAYIRKRIIESGVVEAIITFPKNLFTTTEIPFCLWLIHKGKYPRSEILFVNAARMMEKGEKQVSVDDKEKLLRIIDDYRQHRKIERHEEYAVAGLEEIEVQGYLLSPNLYLKSCFNISVQSNTERLHSCIRELQKEDIGSKLSVCLGKCHEAFVSDQWSKRFLCEVYESSTGIMKQKSSFGCGVPMLDTKAVVRNFFVPGSIDKRVQASREERERFGIRMGDVLLSRTSETVNGLACSCVAMQDEQAVFGGYLKRLRPYMPYVIHPGYAAGYFRSDIFRKIVADNTCVFTTRATLNDRMLERMHIYFPDWETQCIIGDTMYAIFQETESCQDTDRRSRLKNLQTVLIEQTITSQIIRNFNEEDSFSE